MQLDQALDLYVATNPRITSRDTVRRYRTATNNLSRHLGRPATTADLSPDCLIALIKARQRTGHVAAGTIRGEAEKLCVIARWWASYTGQPEPTIALPPPAETEPIAWTPSEIRQLLRAAKASRRRVGHVPASIFWPALVGVAYDTGERVNAIHQLEADDFDLARLRVRFRRETRKGRRTDKSAPLSRETAASVRRLIAERPSAPFAPIKVASLYPSLRWLLYDAGLPADRCRKFHCLRRTHATHVHLQGGDATASLGHTNPEVTRRSYIDRSQIPQVLPSRAGLWSRLWRRWAG